MMRIIIKKEPGPDRVGIWCKLKTEVKSTKSNIMVIKLAKSKAKYHTF